MEMKPDFMLCLLAEYEGEEECEAFLSKVPNLKDFDIYIVQWSIYIFAKFVFLTQQYLLSIKQEETGDIGSQTTKLTMPFRI